MDNYYIKYLEGIKKSNRKIKSIMRCNNTEEFKDYLTNSLRHRKDYDFSNKMYRDNCYVKNSKSEKNNIEKIKENIENIKNLSKECEKILEAMEKYNEDSEIIYRNYDLNREIMVHNICSVNCAQKK